MTEALQIRALSETEFSQCRLQWQELLARSDADPLFMSWDWQWLWWTHHQRVLHAQLRLWSVRSGEGRLLALIPLYERRVRVRGLSLRRLEIIGSAWRNADAFYSEYLDIIVDRAARAAIEAVVIGCLRQMAWDEFVIAGALPDSHVTGWLKQAVSAYAAIRPADEATSYRVSLASGFEAFAQALPPSVRRRVVNHRKRLQNPGLERATPEDIDTYLALLHGFKRARWGDRRADSPAIRAFERELVLTLQAHGRLALTALRVQGALVSVMCNARVGGVEYYLQSAFDASRAGGVSLGYLHFGYAMEAAAGAGVTRFDLLAGGGLRTDYKQELASTALPLGSYQAIRPLWLRALHTIYRVCRVRLRSGRA